MLYVIVNDSGITELHEDAEEILVAGALALTSDQMLALQLGTSTFANGVLVTI